MGNSRLPNEFLDQIINDESLPPMHRILHWIYREYFGYNKRFINGHLDIKSFSAIAKKLNIDRSNFMRSLKKLEELKYIKIVVNYDHNACSQIRLRTVVKNDNNHVVKNDNKALSKMTTINAEKSSESKPDKTLKQSLKQDLKTRSKTKNEWEDFFLSEDGIAIWSIANCQKLERLYKKDLYHLVKEKGYEVVHQIIVSIVTSKDKKPIYDPVKYILGAVDSNGLKKLDEHEKPEWEDILLLQDTGKKEIDIYYKHILPLFRLEEYKKKIHDGYFNVKNLFQFKELKKSEIEYIFELYLKIRKNETGINAYKDQTERIRAKLEQDRKLEEMKPAEYPQDSIGMNNNA